MSTSVKNQRSFPSSPVGQKSTGAEGSRKSAKSFKGVGSSPMVLKSGSEKAETVMKAAVGRTNGIEIPPGPVKSPRSRTGGFDVKSTADLGKQKSAMKKGRSEVKGKVKKDKKKKIRPRKKTLFEKMAMWMGFYVGEVVLKDSRAIEAAQALNLKQWHLKRLKIKFDKIDIDSSGNIDIDEFFEAVGEERSPFTEKLFALIDLDGSGTIEFDEFVRVLATYCMFSKDEILRFCFECFDVDRSGSIDEKEFVELCKSINNAAPSFPNNFRRALEEFDVNEDGLIDYEEFLEIDRRYPIVLFPAFRLQDVMQRNTLGESAWLKIIESYQHNRRVEEYKALNGGRSPPEPPMTVFLKAVFPCFYGEKVHIAVGAEMEARHRAEQEAAMVPTEEQ